MIERLNAESWESDGRSGPDLGLFNFDLELGLTVRKLIDLNAARRLGGGQREMQ